jgi:hypothetical protein
MASTLGLQIGSSDNTLNDYTPILCMNLHDATRLEVRFSAAKFTIMDLTKWRVSPRTSSKKLILYFSWCSFQSFSKNWHKSQPLCPRRGKQLRNRKNALSIWWHLLSFLSNCGVQLSAEIAVIWSHLSNREMGGNI